MDYRELFKAAELFKKDEWAYDSAYVRAREAIDWEKLRLYPDDVIKRVVLGFLNDWKCS